MKTIEGVKNWYWQNETKVGSIALLVGFVFDNLTLRRVDLLAENIYIITLLVMI